MSILNQIQNALAGIEQAAFQKLADTYLHKLGYERINSLGSVPGADKTRKGTPDTFVPLENGNYVFAEHTTRQTAVAAKFEEDVRKALDPSRTGVPVERVERIILCCNSNPSLTEVEALRTLAGKEGVLLDMHTLDSISQALLNDYPKLARDFLGVSIDTGQVLSIDDFVETHDRNGLAAPLDTEFRFREDDLDQALAALDQEDLLVVTGEPGVGKSRFAVECARKFEQRHTEYTVYGIYNLGIDIYDDLITVVADPGPTLLVVDDANKLSSFDFLISLIETQTEDKGLKVIATVRGYALPKLRDSTEALRSAPEIELQKLSDDQIKELVEFEFGIKNKAYQDRIAEISAGNARLAVMAAKIALRENTLASIDDISSLYAEYFGPILKELEAIHGEDSFYGELLRVAAIVAFFRVVDLSSESTMQSIEKAFGITLQDFREYAGRLRRLEILDTSEVDENVFRPADQVLATYFFYLACFEYKSLSFAAILSDFFPEQNQLIVEALNPVLQAFDSRGVVDEVRPMIEDEWNSAVENDDQTRLIHLADKFGFLLPTRALSLAQSAIEGLQTIKVDSDFSDLEPDSNVAAPSILSILSRFGSADLREAEIAIELLLRYVGKRSNDAGNALHILVEDFGFDGHSHHYAYATQSNLIMRLGEATEDGKNELYSSLFIVVANHFLKFEFSKSWTKDRRTVSWSNVHLLPIPELIELREAMWRRLHLLGANDAYLPAIREILEFHSTSTRRNDDAEIIESDSSHVQSIVRDYLNPERFPDCLVANRYLDGLDERGIAVEEGLRERFQTEAYEVFGVVCSERHERRLLEMEYDEYLAYRKQRLIDYTKDFDLAAYERFFQHCHTIASSGIDQYEVFQIGLSLTGVLKELADSAGTLFLSSLEMAIGIEGLLTASEVIANELIKVLGCEQALKFILDQDVPNQAHWLLHIYAAIPEAEVNEVHTEHIISLHESAESDQLLFGLDYLLKFRTADDRIVPKIAGVLVNRVKEESQYIQAIGGFFHAPYAISSRLGELFAYDVEILSEAYLMADQRGMHTDYDGRCFAQILDVDLRFLSTYIASRYKQERYPTHLNDSRSYAWLWQRDDVEEVLSHAITTILDHDADLVGHGYSYLDTFFRPDRAGAESADVIQRQDAYLATRIRAEGHNSLLMALLFDVICNFEDVRRLRFVELFLETNDSIDDFQRLSLLPTSSGAWSSLVPYHEQRMEFLQSIFPLLRGADYLQHREYLEQLIRSEESVLAWTKKREFVRD